MEVTKEMLIEEIKTLQKAAKLHAKYSIEQYKRVLNYVKELEKEKKSLEKKVKERTIKLRNEIEEKEKLSQELQLLAKYDQLTSLANRYMFFSQIEELTHKQEEFSILFIDLDGFKLINDTYGHEVGDIVLKSVANRMRKVVRSSDLIARLGGDEFTILLRGLTDLDKLKEIASILLKKITEPIFIGDLKVRVGASIGIYIFDKKDSINDIITKADIAMYEAKKRGKGRYIFFDDYMKEELRRRLEVKEIVKNAVKKRTIRSVFQPIVSSLDFSIKGVEVLARCKKATPDIFIPILEEDVMILKEFTYNQIETIVKLQKEIKDIFFSINISGKLLLDSEIVVFIDSLIRKYKFDTSRIYFEVTETAVASNLEFAAAILKMLKRRGFQISLDDFGTGYSSLAYIKKLPIDNIKIDKAFIKNLHSPKDFKLFKAIITMSEILEMRVILEGIENEEQLKYIKPAEYIKYQGFLFYKPMEFDELKKVLKEKSGTNF